MRSDLLSFAGICNVTRDAKTKHEKVAFHAKHSLIYISRVDSGSVGIKNNKANECQLAEI